MNDAENQLLLGCVRWTIDGSSADRIRAIVEDGIDWTVLVKAALRHQVSALLYRALRETCLDAVPVALLDALRIHAEEIANGARLLSDELLAIVGDCERRSVAVIPFKGPTLAVLAFGDTRWRISGDLDLMIDESDVPAISDVLTARGFERVDVQDPPLPEHLEAAYQRYERQIVFVRQSDGMVVEPQWAVTTHMHAFAVDYAALRDRAIEIDFAGRRLASYALEDLLLLLCIHGMKHYWSALRWIADIAALVSAQPGMDLEVSVRRAEALGCRRVMLLGLALARTLFGTTLPDDVQRRIDADPTCQWLVAETIEGLFREDYDPPGSLELTSYRMRLRERFGDRCRTVWRTIVTPRVPHFGIVRLPRALAFLYYPIKLIHDYAALPLWLVFKSDRPRKVESQA